MTMNVFTITSSFSEVPTAVEKGLNLFNSNPDVKLCACVCVRAFGGHYSILIVLININPANIILAGLIILMCNNIIVQHCFYT